MLKQVQKLLKDKNYSEAECICESINSFQYEDEIDLKMNNLKSAIYRHNNNCVLSNKYLNAYSAMKNHALNDYDSDRILRLINEYYAEKSTNSFVKVIEWHIEHLRYVECGILLSHFLKGGKQLPENVVQSLEKETTLLSFSKYLSSRTGLFTIEDGATDDSSCALNSFYKDLLKDIGWIEHAFESEIGYGDDKPWILFATKGWLESEFVKNKKCLNMFYRHYEDLQGLTHFYALFVGDYFSFLNNRYNFNISCKSFVNTSVDFTILLPVRNSIKYLEKTIQTCKNIVYSGTYEILISDNSTDKTDEILDLISKANDSHIRYIKTPCDLPLARSFEYGYLSALGNYIISLGSDDGVMPNALDYLKQAFSRHNVDIVMSPLASYFWETYPYKEKTNELCFSSCNKYHENFLDMAKYRSGYAINQIYYLWLPMMYMTTCVSKKMIFEIIEKTGKFEMGYSQDVYTGIANALINEKILYINYPIVVAGNSDIGTGVNCSSKDDFKQRIKQYKSFNSSFETLNIVSPDFSKIEKILNYSTVFLSFSEFLKIEALVYENSHKLALNKNQLIEAYLSDPTNEFDKKESRLVVKQLTEVLNMRTCIRQGFFKKMLLSAKKNIKRSKIIRFLWNRARKNFRNDTSYNPFLYEIESIDARTTITKIEKSDIVAAVNYVNKYVFKEK